MKYIRYDQKGNIISWSNRSREGYLEVSDDIDLSLYKVHNGSLVLASEAPDIENEVYTGKIVEDPTELAILKTDYTRQINEFYATLRLNDVTPGNEEVYFEKNLEALDYLNNVEREYPFLSNELGITGETLQEIATKVANKANERRSMLISTEQKRKAKIKAISDATTIAELQAIMLTVE